MAANMTLLHRLFSENDTTCILCDNYSWTKYDVVNADGEGVTRLPSTIIECPDKYFQKRITMRARPGNVKLMVDGQSLSSFTVRVMNHVRQRSKRKPVINVNPYKVWLIRVRASQWVRLFTFINRATLNGYKNVIPDPHWGLDIWPNVSSDNYLDARQLHRYCVVMERLTGPADGFQYPRPAPPTPSQQSQQSPLTLTLSAPTLSTQPAPRLLTPAPPSPPTQPHLLEFGVNPQRSKTVLFCQGVRISTLRTTVSEIEVPSFMNILCFEQRPLPLFRQEITLRFAGDRHWESVDYRQLVETLTADSVDRHVWVGRIESPAQWFVYISKQHLTEESFEVPLRCCMDYQEFNDSDEYEVYSQCRMFLQWWFDRHLKLEM